MDINDLRSAVTVVSMLLFVGMAVWTWQRARTEAFEEAAALPFAGEAFEEAAAEAGTSASTSAGSVSGAQAGSGEQR